jgi:Uma2 family endonuclease
MTDPYQETLEGGLCLRLPPGERHELICRRLHSRIAEALAPSKGIARLLTVRSEITFSEDAVVCPDLTLVTVANNKPFLVAEIINSGDHSPDTVIKKSIYEEFKLPRLWMVDPRYDNVEIYHGGPYGLVLKDILAVRDVLAEPLLPGFEYLISDLFSAESDSLMS